MYAAPRWKAITKESRNRHNLGTRNTPDHLKLVTWDAIG